MQKLALCTGGALSRQIVFAVALLPPIVVGILSNSLVAMEALRTRGILSNGPGRIHYEIGRLCYVAVGRARRGRSTLSGVTEMILLNLGFSFRMPASRLSTMPTICICRELVSHPAGLRPTSLLGGASEESTYIQGGTLRKGCWRCLICDEGW